MRCGECKYPILERDPVVVHRLDLLHSECLTRRLGSIRKLDDLVRDEITHALWAVEGDKEAAAKALGISVRTIYRKMKKLNGGPN